MPQIRSLLVFGDSKDWAEICSGLERDGFGVRRMPPDAGAAGVLEKERCDALLADLDALPDLGAGLLQAARLRPETVVLAFARPESPAWREPAVAAAIQALLPKPAAPALLKQCLERGWEKARMARELRARDKALETLNREFDSKMEEATRELRELNHRILSEMASLREVDRLKSSFLGNVTHDLKNPLTTLRGYVSYLLESPELSAEDRKFCLENARAAVMHMDYLINQLLEAARLSSGKIQLNVQELRVAEILKEAGALVQGQTQAGKIRFEIIADSGPELSLRADRGRLLQILSNLLGNACKFTPQNGRIGLRAWSEKENVHFCVEDSGIGIALEHQVRIFEKFYQVQSAQSKSFKGLGLGLRIAKEIVELHGGRIWVESQPGMGSRFHFVLARQGPPA